jgi:hypothetical protein
MASGKDAGSRQPAGSKKPQDLADHRRETYTGFDARELARSTANRRCESMLSVTGISVRCELGSKTLNEQF